MRISIMPYQLLGLAKKKYHQHLVRIQGVDAHAAPQMLRASVAKAAGKIEDHREVH